MYFLLDPVLESIRGMKCKTCICLDFNKTFDIAPCGKLRVR